MEYIEVKCLAPQGGRAGPRFGSKLEHRIVRVLIRGLKKHGFLVHSVAHDEYVRTPNERLAMWEVFEVDECTLRFRKVGTDKLFGVLLIGGNGTDIICDYSLPDGEPVWEKVMNEITDKIYEENA
jgi:hypothetical protein